MVWVEEIPWKFAGPELLNKTLLPWLRGEENKTKFTSQRINMKVTFSETLNILSWTNVEKTFLTYKNHGFEKNALILLENNFRVTRVVPSNGSWYSRMDKVKFAETAFKKFEVKWSA